MSQVFLSRESAAALETALATCRDAERARVRELLGAYRSRDEAKAEVERLKAAIRKHQATWMRPKADEELYAVLREETPRG